MSYTKVQIKSGREKSIKRWHPWVFSGSINGVERDLVIGECVEMISESGEFLGIGHYCGGSLAIKMLSSDRVEIDQDWYKINIRQAFERKKNLGFPNSETNAYRLVHGEGDGLPSLIIDIYNEVAVVQPHSPGMQMAIPMILAGLKEIGFENVVHKPVDKAKSEVLSGEVGNRTSILECGVKYVVDTLDGQKTGFFLDQRDNRSLLANYSSDKKILNVFSYTGGFSMAALKAGAEEATSLDSAQSALDIAVENAMVNSVNEGHKTVKADAVPYLEHITEAYQIIVLDPPAFAKHKSARHNAIKAYRRINEAAIKAVDQGGMLFTFSCSQVIDRQLFYDIVSSAAINAGRKARVLHHMRQPADHPVSIFHPEGEYLKGLVLLID